MKLRQYVRQQAAGEGGHGGDIQLAAPQRKQVAYIVQRSLPVLQQALHNRVELCPFRGECHRAGGALQQFTADAGLEIADGDAQRRLRQV